MRSIAYFIGEPFPEADIFNCEADPYARIAKDVRRKNEEHAHSNGDLGVGADRPVIEGDIIKFALHRTWRSSV